MTSQDLCGLFELSTQRGTHSSFLLVPRTCCFLTQQAVLVTGQTFGPPLSLPPGFPSVSQDATPGLSQAQIAFYCLSL